jgi:hypothetical protein
MKVDDIVRQLKIYLPSLTDYFTDLVPVATLTSSGLVATVTTTVPHNLVTGAYAHISGALVPNPITTLVRTGTIASATTTYNHDQTFGYQENVLISGATEALYNGSHKLLSVPNRKNFTYEISASAPLVATGSPQILEDLKWEGYNGWHSITVIDSVTFTFPLSRVLRSPASGTILLKVNPRIAGVVSIDEAREAYTKQVSSKLWAFVVAGDISASRNRSEETDATFVKPNWVEFRQLVLQPIHVFIMIPSTDRISKRYARDMADDLLVLLCQTLTGATFSSGFTEEPYSTLVFRTSAFGTDGNSFYIHEFVFEGTAQITFADTFVRDESVAFRDVVDKYQSVFIDDDEIKFEGNINLDEVPLT